MISYYCNKEISVSMLTAFDEDYRYVGLTEKDQYDMRLNTQDMIWLKATDFDLQRIRERLPIFL